MLLPKSDNQSFMKTLNLELTTWGRNKATTFHGFCSHHDTNVFKSIENYNFQYQNLMQMFLYIYRCFAVEFYKKKETVDFFSALNKIYPTKYNILTQTIEQKSLTELLSYKKIFDNDLVNNHNSFNYLNWKLDYDCKFAASGIFLPDYDLNGKKLQKYQGDNKWIFFSIFPQNTETYIILSWAKKEDCLFKEYMEKLNQLSIKNKLNYLNNLIILSTENLVINPTAINNLHTFQKQNIMDNFIETVSSANRYWRIQKDMLGNHVYNLFSL